MGSGEFWWLPQNVCDLQLVFVSFVVGSCLIDMYIQQITLSHQDTIETQRSMSTSDIRITHVHLCTL